VWMSSRASWAARSPPTPQSEATGAPSGAGLVCGSGIARTIQTVSAGFNGKGAGQISITVTSGRQLKRNGSGNQPMPEVTYSGPDCVRYNPRSYSPTQWGTMIDP
jgi:hypothetical protein